VDFHTNRAGVDFIFLDCDLAMTFLNVADTTKIPETVKRNRQKARKAYDTVRHLLPSLLLTIAETQAIERKLLALRTRMEAAGEEF
jgi:hypothetical protein